MNMGSVSDYKLGKTRYQELEADVRRSVYQEELLGQLGARYPQYLSVSFSTLFGIAIGVMVLGVQLLGL